MIKPKIKKVVIEANFDSGFFYIIKEGKTYKNSNIEKFKGQLKKEINKVVKDYYAVLRDRQKKETKDKNNEVL